MELSKIRATLHQESQVPAATDAGAEGFPQWIFNKSSISDIVKGLWGVVLKVVLAYFPEFFGISKCFTCLSSSSSSASVL